MKTRDLIVYVIGGLVAAGLIAFSATRLMRKPQLAPAAVATTTQSAESSVRRMKLAELQQHLNRGDVTLIDVRDADAYVAAHIPSALHIPVQYIEGEIQYLPKGKPIVTYCT